ncbi:MAG: hypothetical protein AAF449_08390 [Myxococcota bacterium]
MIAVETLSTPARDDELVTALVEAIPNLAIYRHFKQPKDIGGFAFCFDDQMSCLLAFAASRRWLARQATDLRFYASDWILEEPLRNLQVPAGILHSRFRRAGEAGLDTHVSDSFERIIAALQKARTRRLFSPETILFATSLGADDMVHSLTGHGVRRLNGNDAYQAWCQSWAEN